MNSKVSATTPRYKGYGFVTNPGEPGWVDPKASPEVQAQQRELRVRLRNEFFAQARAREEGSDNG